MELSTQWLNDYTPIDMPADDLAHRLTMAGLEVEEIRQVGADTVMDLEITPNRPDCLSMIGLAREVSAIYGQRLNIPDAEKPEGTFGKTEIAVEDKLACRRYIGIVIEGVNVKASEGALRSRIESLGMRGVNNVVDVTNFCLMETGQPMHAFDLDKLKGGRIHVRRARKGEHLITIDGVERKLDPGVLVIADDCRPVAMAGIMGGQDTEVTASTKNILLESAYFDPILVRRTVRAMGLASDSSYRFERGVYFAHVSFGAHRACRMIQEVAGGSVRRYGDVRGAPMSRQDVAISFAVSQFNARMGANIASGQCRDILHKLGFSVDDGASNAWVVSPPPFRGDIRRFEDVVEEVARVVGYDQLPETMPYIRRSSVKAPAHLDMESEIRQILQAQGLDEIITYTMTHQEALNMCRETVSGVAVMNPLSQDLAMMRPSLLPSMMAVLKGNMSRGNQNIRMFETGKIYPAGIGQEEPVVGILVSGQSISGRGPSLEPVGFFHAKGLLENLTERLHVSEVSWEPIKDARFFGSEQASIVFGGRAAGCLGRIHPDVIECWGIKMTDPVYYAQVSMDAFARTRAPQQAFQPLSEYPAVQFDISLAVKEDVTYQAVHETIEQAASSLLSDISFREEYRGKGVQLGKKALVLSLTYQSAERTLTDEEVKTVHEQIVQSLSDRLGAVRR